MHDPTSNGRSRRRYRWALLGALILRAASAHAGPLVGGAVNQDPAGWSFHAAGAASPTHPCVAMSAHAPAQTDNKLGIFVSCFDGGAWHALGGRISGIASYAPRLTMIGETPYVTWYEGGGYNIAHVFVAHHDGASWVLDGASGLGDATHVENAPTLAVVGGVLYAAWSDNACAHVAHLAAGAWSDDAACVRGDANATVVRDLSIASIGGVLHLALSEDHEERLETSSLGIHLTRAPLGVNVLRLVGNAFTPVGGALAAATEVHGADLLDLGGVPYVAWAQQVGRLGGAYVAHFDGASWVGDGGPLNADTQLGWAQRPTLGAFGGVLFVAFGEHSPGQPARIQVRHLQAGAFVLDSVANNDPSASAEGPRLFGDGTTLRLVFTEKPALPGVGTVYVRTLP